MKTRNVFLLASLSVILLTVTLSYAQAPDTLWTRTYGGTMEDYAISGQQLPDGNYIIVGYTTSFGAGGFDACLVKIDSVGDTLWTRTYGGTGEDRGYSIRQATAGGYVIGGYTTSFGVGMDDGMIIKTDSVGNTTWLHTFGGFANDHFGDVRETHDQGFIATGYTESFGAGGKDLYLVRTDRSGDTLWTRAYGSSQTEEGARVQQTSDRGFLAVGYTNDNGTYDFYLVKTDSVGDTLWTRTYGGNGTEFALDVQPCSDGSFILVGPTSSVGSTWNIKLHRVSETGNTIWGRTLVRSHDQGGYSIDQCSDGGFIISGYYTSQYSVQPFKIYLVKTDSLGDTLWTQKYGGTSDEWTNYVQQTSDDGYFIVGYTESFGAGMVDMYVIKTEAEGNPNVPNLNVESAPKDFALFHAYPNPFNAITTIYYDVSLNGRVQVDVYNILGERVATVAEHQAIPGRYLVTWDAGDLPSGIYFCRMQAGDFQQVRKVVLLK